MPVPGSVSASQQDQKPVPPRGVYAKWTLWLGAGCFSASGDGSGATKRLAGHAPGRQGSRHRLTGGRSRPWSGWRDGSTAVWRTGARWRLGVARIGREDRSRRRFDANSSRGVGPTRAADFGLRAYVDWTEACKGAAPRSADIRENLIFWNAKRRLKRRNVQGQLAHDKKPVVRGAPEEGGVAWANGPADAGPDGLDLD